MADEKIIHVLTLRSEMEAAMMEDILKDKDIPFVLSHFNDPGLTGFYTDLEGWGVIEAPEENAEEIRGLYDSILNNDKE